MPRIPYHEFPGLEDVYLEDSYVLGVKEDPDRVVFDLDLVLTPGHAEYRPPRPDEQHDYRRAALEFPHVRSATWGERRFEPFTDATGQVDYGSIDLLYRNDRTYHVQGDWGDVDIESDLPVIRLVEGAPETHG